MGLWHGAETFITDLPSTKPLRHRYEQAVGTVMTALAVIPSLEALIADYYAPAEDRQWTTETLRRVCAAETPDQEQRLEGHLVESAAYYRRAKHLLTQWWVTDWQQPPPADTASTTRPPRARRRPVQMTPPPRPKTSRTPPPSPETAAPPKPVPPRRKKAT